MLESDRMNGTTSSWEKCYEAQRETLLKKETKPPAATRQSTLIPAAMKGDLDSLVAPDPVHMLSSLATALQISDSIEKKALEIYGRVRTQKLDRGRPSFAFAAASLYAA